METSEDQEKENVENSIEKNKNIILEEEDEQNDEKETQTSPSTQDTVGQLLEVSKENKDEKPRASASPKMTRPKLPEFTGNGRIGHAGSQERSKTDPGRGGEIKAIIDQTMEDIKELNKVDFAIFNRPKKFPKPFTHRSQSTHVSPRASPTHCSPMEENPTLNRSRSLKLLTDMLKSGRGGVNTEYKSGHIPRVEDLTSGNNQSGSDGQLGQSSEEGGEDRKSSSDGQLQGKKVAKYDKDSLMSRSQDSASPGPVKKDRKKHDDKGHHRRPRFGLSGKHKDSAAGFRRAKSEVRKIQLSDDEGLDVTSDHENQSPAKGYHSIDTNSQFFTLYKTGSGTSKRRPGFAGLVHNRFKSNSQGEESPPGKEEPGVKRFNRVELKPIGAKNRFQSLRHITHPPHSQATYREGGTMDSNGFGSVLKSPMTESPPPFPDDIEKTSDFSLTDSQAGQSDSMDDASYVDLDENLMARSCDSVELEKPEKKNGKGGKQKSKSKSDPTHNSNKSGEKAVDLPQVINSSHSSPLLSKDSENEEEEEEKGDTEIEMEIDETSAQRKISGCRRPLGHSGSLDEGSQGSPLQFEAEDGSLRSYSLDEEGSMSPGSEPCNNLPRYVSTLNFGGASAPSTPVSQSPTNTLDRSQYLDVPGVVNNKKSIARSVSSASVLQRERKYSGGAKENKDLMRKHSMTNVEDASTAIPPNLLALGGTPQTTSMPSMLPVLWKGGREPSMSPERDPALVKVSSTISLKLDIHSHTQTYTVIHSHTQTYTVIHVHQPSLMTSFKVNHVKHAHEIRTLWNFFIKHVVNMFLTTIHRQTLVHEHV